MVASTTQINSPLNFPLKQICFVTVVPKYFKCVTCSKDLSATFMLWISPEFRWGNSTYT
jgi:hypothetical protein